MRDTGADTGILVGITEEIHNFLQFRLLFVSTGHVRKGDLFAIGNAQNGSGLAKVLQGIGTIELAHEHCPEHQQYDTDNQQRQDIVERRYRTARQEIIAFQNTGGHLLFKQRSQFLTEAFRICHGRCYGGFSVIGCGQFQFNGVIFHHKTLDLLIAEHFHNLRIGQIGIAHTKHIHDPGQDHKQNAQIDQNG